MTTPAITLILTPAGRLILAPSEEIPALPEELQHRLEQAFHQTAGHGLLDLGLREVGTILPPTFAFWRDFAARYVTTLCITSDASDEKTPTASGATRTRAPA